jgi:hypothetical protein
MSILVCINNFLKRLKPGETVRYFSCRVDLIKHQENKIEFRIESKGESIPDIIQAAINIANDMQWEVIVRFCNVHRYYDKVELEFEVSDPIKVDNSLERWKT